MGRWLRRLRGVLGIGAVWGAVGAVASSAVGLLGLVLGRVPLEAIFEIALGGGSLGFLLGSVFAGTLALMEGRRRLDELSTARSALWGALVGAAAPFAILLVAVAPIVGLEPLLDPRVLLAMLSGSAAYGGVCAALAAGTVALAKRAPDELPPAP